MLFSHHNGEKTMVLLCFRLKMLMFDRFYCVFAQKTLSSVAKHRFCGYELAKPFVLPLQIVALPKTRHVFGLLWKKPE